MEHIPISDFAISIITVHEQLRHFVNRPLILLRSKESIDKVPVDLQEFLYLEYQKTDNLDMLVEQIKDKLQAIPDLRNLRSDQKIYLSQSVLGKEADISSTTVKKIVDRFQSSIIM
jgi:hypothetical protein